MRVGERSATTNTGGGAFDLARTGDILLFVLRLIMIHGSIRAYCHVMLIRKVSGGRKVTIKHIEMFHRMLKQRCTYTCLPVSCQVVLVTHQNIDMM